MIASTLTIALSLLATVKASHDVESTLTRRTTCAVNTPVTCSTSTSQNACCYESQGLIEQVQFWDTDPVTGPTTSWTIHGLWRDGTYQENCDSSRDYSSITSILNAAGQSALVNYMNTYWVSDDESNEAFWEHEWDTHGTCYSTIAPSCLPAGSAKGADAVAFFERAVSLFKTLPTYTFLSAAGITPSSSKTYTYSTLETAISGQYGYTPSLDCSSSTLDSITYYFHLQGNLQNGTLVPINAPSSGSCPTKSIKYPPK